MTRQRASIGATLGRYVAGSVVVAVLVVAGVALRVLVTAGQDQRERADAIVVLGAAQYQGDPSTIFQARLTHALELYRAGVAAHVVTVGGNQAGDEFTEAEAGKNFLVAQGVPADAVRAVGVGNDTLVSLRAGAEVMRAAGWSSVVVVTDPWHAYRAGRMASDLGFHVQVSSVDTGPAAQSGVAPRYLLRETLGTLYYRLVDGSSGLGGAVL